MSRLTTLNRSKIVMSTVVGHTENVWSDLPHKADTRSSVISKVAKSLAMRRIAHLARELVGATTTSDGPPNCTPNELDSATLFRIMQETISTYLGWESTSASGSHYG
jgi:hypothetical protein